MSDFENLPSIPQILRQSQLLARKSLGQNFLKDAPIAQKIVDGAQIEKKDSIVEIGPGVGSLTRYIMNARPKNIILIEKDTRIPSILEQSYKTLYPNYRLLEEDALKVSFPKLFE